MVESKYVVSSGGQSWLVTVSEYTGWEGFGTILGLSGVLIALDVIVGIPIGSWVAIHDEMVEVLDATAFNWFLGLQIAYILFRIVANAGSESRSVLKEVLMEAVFFTVAYWGVFTVAGHRLMQEAGFGYTLGEVFNLILGQMAASPVGTVFISLASSIIPVLIIVLVSGLLFGRSNKS